MRRVMILVGITMVLLVSSCSNSLQMAEQATVRVNVYKVVDSVEEYQGHGSGFIVDKRGYIITNNHVVQGSDIVKIKFDLLGREEIIAEVLGRDPIMDIAVLKIITKRKLSVLKFGNSDKIRTGNLVTAIGFPYRLNKTVTIGYVQGLRGIGTPGKGGFLMQIQHGAAINGGNSGGPLILNGLVVGMNNAIPTYTGHFNGYAVAIPSNVIKEFYEAVLKDRNKIRKGC